MRDNKTALLFSNGSTSRVIEICKPLQNYFGITFFSYIRIYNDCNYLTLRNGYQELSQRYFEIITNPDPDYLSSLRSTAQEEPNSYLWPTNFSQLPCVASLLDAYGIWHGITITYRTDNFCENFNFAFNKNTGSMNQFYVQNFSLLKKFCDHFRLQAKDLLEDSNSEKLATYKNKFDISYIPANEKKLLFLNEIDYIKENHFINNRGTLIKLTKRESECVKLIMQYKTIKEIGRTLEISPRTIETHICHIKRKFNVNYKNELFNIFSREIQS
ncbi:MAG: LuxR C-terminal-related transcriptional regulator [Rickettsiales bacterium]